MGNTAENEPAITAVARFRAYTVTRIQISPVHTFTESRLGSSQHSTVIFNFRIVQGHTIDNLIKLKLTATRVYSNFAWIAIFTILYGEELIRDAYILV